MKISFSLSLLILSALRAFRYKCRKIIQVCPYTSRSCTHRLKMSTSVANCKIQLGHPHYNTCKTHLPRFLSWFCQLLVHLVSDKCISLSRHLCQFNISSFIYRWNISASPLNCNVLIRHLHDITTQLHVHVCRYLI